MNDTKKLLEVRDLHKAYSKEGVPTKALNGITFDVLNGEYLGIMGASGSGKTTLLNCIATVIKPTSGQILLSGANISSFDGTKLAEYRGNKIGYLFQDFALLDNLTGKENIILPLSIHNIDIVTAEKKLKDIADFGVMEAIKSNAPYTNFIKNQSAQNLINLSYFNWTYILCSIAISVLVILLLHKTKQKSNKG